MRSRFFICAALLSFSAESRAQPVVNSGAQIITKATSAASIVSGTTLITGGAATQICFNDAGVISCGNAALVFDKATGTLTVTILSAGSGAITTLSTGTLTATNIVSGFNLGDPDTTITRSAASTMAIEGDPVVTLAAAQNMNGGKTFSGGVVIAQNTALFLGPGGTAGPHLWYDPAMTPDGPMFDTDNISNAYTISEASDAYQAGFDFQWGDCGTTICTDPHLIIRSHNRAITEYGSWFNDGVHTYLKTGVGGLGLPGMIFTVGTVPVVSNTTANSCGTTAATITGTDSTGVVTVGAGAGTSCTLALNVAALNRRQCWCSNETTLGNLCNTHYTDTTHTNLVGTFVAGDKVNYGCLSY